MIERSIELEGNVEFRNPRAALVDGLSYVSRIAIERGGAPARLLERFVSDLRAGELQLPVLPDSVSRVMPLIAEPEVDLGELARLVELDPVLAIKTVGVANSAYYRGVERAQSVRDALMRMGLRQARNVVLAVALRSSLFKVRGYEAQAQAVWFHSLFTAFAAQELLAEVAPWQDSGFLLGLSHDVGRIAVLSFAARERQRAPDDAPYLRAEIVREVSDLLHEQLGGLAVDAWDFADAATRAIAHHHDPEVLTGEPLVLARALAAADLLAHRIEDGWSEEEGVVTPELAQRLEAIAVDPRDCMALVGEIHAGFEAFAKQV
ncbi:MAG: HDOD domain-containing protein [bacterium]|nr:HDOD domain-containing protein [bacterium]MCP5041612.1 HDOD domain-containing protein [bacterium]